METNLQKLREHLLKAAANGKTNLTEILKEIGITPDNPDMLKELVVQAGLNPADLTDKGKIIEFINSMSRNLSPEIKGSIANLYNQLAQEMGGKLPEDLQDFLAQWKKG